MNNFESSTTPKTPRFQLGKVYCTPGALETMERLQVNPLALLGRHIRGDWGSVCSEDALSNVQALRDGSRIFSVYELTANNDTASTSESIWLITEADRSATTILLPDEY
jgi:hypothetical protein